MRNQISQLIHAIKGSVLKNAPFFIPFLTGVVIFTGCEFAFGFSGGPPAERTGNPDETCGDDTCASSCHTGFSVNSGAARFSVSQASSQYKPGQTIDVTIAFNETSAPIHGFEITAVDASGNKVGAFSAKDETTQTEPYDNLYAAHTRVGTVENRWTVQWTAPTANVSSPITFYAVGNAANGNSMSNGDYIYTDTATISLATECAPSTLKIKPKKVALKRGKSAVVTVTVKGENNEPCANHTVYASAENKKVSIDESMETNDKGKAKFTVTAGNEKGKDTLTFSTKDDDTEITKSIKVLVK